MEASSTYLKTSFLRFIVHYFAVPFLLLLAPGLMGDVYGQTKEYATVTPSGGRNAAGVLAGIYGTYAPTTNDNLAQIRNIPNAGTSSDTEFAELEASNTVVLGIGGAGEAWVQMKFPANIPANTTTYIQIGELEREGGGLDLGNIVGGLLGLLSENVIIPEAYTGATASSDGTQVASGNVFSTIVQDKDGNLYVAVRPSATYNAVRIKLRNGESDLLTVIGSSTLLLDVYNAFYFSSADPCIEALFTDQGQSTGISVNLSETVKNAGFAIDENTSNYSEISTGALSIASTAYQNIYFPSLSEADATLNVRLQISASALNADLLGAYHVRVYNGNSLIEEYELTGGLISGLDLLGLLSSGGIATIPFEVDQPFDRVEIGLFNTLGLNLGASNLRIYGVNRTSAGCPPPPPTPSPLIDPVCANATIVAMQNVDDPQNAVDGDFDSYATVRSDAGVLIGLGSNEGHLEVAFDNPVPVGKTAYVRIDYDESVLKALLAGSLGNVVAYLLDNLVLGNHYFDVVLTNNGTSVLTTSGNDFFANANGQVRIVQDRLGRYYIAIKAEDEFTNIRLVDHTVGALGVLTPDKYLNIYSICYENSDAICDPAFATYVDGEGISLAVTPLGDVGVTDAPFAIDGNPATASKITIGNVGAGASIYQYVNYHSLSDEADHFRVKLKMPGGAVTAEVLGSIVIKAFNGNDEVYSQKLTSGLISGLDLLELIANQEMLNIPIAPGRSFDRVAVGIESIVSANVIDNPLEIYSIERFSADCPDPELTVPDPTETPFEQSSCEAEVVAWDHANFPLWAADGNNETFATLSANSGALLGIGAYTGYLEYEFASEIPANKTTYIRIDMEEDLLGRLLSGTLGTLVDNVGGLLLGDHYFSVEAKPSIGGAPVLTGSSQSGFAGVTGGDLRLVQDNIGRYYIAVTPDQPYRNIRITEHFPALVGTTQDGSTMNIYEACQEIGVDACLPAQFTSFDQTGLSLGALNGAGVTNADHAINSNSSDYSEISTGTVAVAAQVSQRIYFNQLSQAGDDLRVRLQMSAPTLLTVDVLGNYEVVTYNGSQEQETFTLQDGGLINDLNLLNILFNSGGIQTLTFETQLPYDRVDVRVNSLLNATLSSPVRLYEVKRIGAGCPPDPATESPFENPTCIAELVDASNADDIQNLFDDDFDTYAVLNSGAGTLLGINEYEGFVELGFGQDIEAGKTAYVRIDFEPTLLENLLGGSIGGALASVVDNLTLGDHYFSIQAKNDNGVVLEGASNNNFGGNTDRIRIVQDKFGRYYIAITPDEAFDAIRITDHTNSTLGLLAQPNTMNIYGACVDNPTADCQPVFVTSFDATGLDLDLADLGGSGVTDASHAIDDNTANYSQVNLGAVAVGKSVEQYFDFRKSALPSEVVNITLSYGTGAVDLSLLGSIEIKAYNETVEVAQLDWNGGIINGVNVLNALNNGGQATIPFGPGVEYDRISVGITGVAGLSVLPALRIYAVEKDCNVPQFVAWKSYVVDGDASIASVKGGETVEYTIHVRNTGAVALEDLILTDVLPANTALVAGSISGGGTETAGTLTWENVDVPVAGEALVSFSVTVDQNLTGVSEIANVALVKLDAADPGTETFPPLDNQNPTDPDESGDTGTIIPVEQINSLVSWKAYAITGGASITSVSGGETVEYSIYVRNLGNQDLTNVVISDVLPEGVEYASGGTLSGSAVQFTIATLPVGATSDPQVFTVTVNENLTGIDVIHNVATVVSDEITTPEESFPPIDNENPTDPDDTGDTGTDIPVDHVSSLVSWKAYEVEGDASITAVSGGEAVEYTIYVRNTGNVNLTNLTISDALPVGVTHVSGGTLTGNTVSFTIGSLTVGETSSPLVFTVKVAEDLTGIDVIRNVATVVSDEVTTPEESFPPVDNGNPTDPDDTGDTGTEIPVDAIHDIEIALNGVSDGTNSGQAISGDHITYTITVTNTGNKDLTGVTLDGQVPANTTFANSADGGTESGGVVSFPPFDLAVGETRTFTYEVVIGTVDPAIVTSIDNTATVTFRNEDNTADETKTATHSMPTDCVTVIAANIVLDADQDAICEGEAVQLTATLSGVVIPDAIFLWYTNAGLTGTPIEGASITVSPTASTTYYVVVSGTGFCFNNPPATISVTVEETPDVPTITIVGGDAEICEGESVELTATAGAATYVWYLDDVELTGETSATLVAEEAGVYTVRGVNAAGCESDLSAGVTVEVLPLPAQPTISYDGAPEICEGNAIILTSSAATGNQWYKDGVALTDSTRQQLIVTEAGNYTVVVTGTNGCPSAPSDAVTIAVNPTPEITIDGPSDYAIAVGGTVQLPAVTTDPAGATVTWLDPDGNPVSGTVGPFNTPGTYIYTVVAESGDCSATASISILVIDPNACPPGYERIYATEVIGSTTGITDPNNAVGGNLVDSANVQVPLLLFGVRNFDLGFGQSFTGEDIHVKLGTRQGVDLLGGVEVSLQPLQDGTPVGTAVTLNSGWLLSLLAGADQGDVMIPTADNITFNGVRIRVRAALVSLAGAIDVHAAYVNTKVEELADCEEVSDILTGATSGVLGSLNGVTNKWAVVEDDVTDFATIRQNVGIAGHVHLTAIYPSQAKAGDSVQVILRNPSGGLLDATVLAGIWVRAYNGNTLVKETAVSGALLNVRLLDGSSDINIVSFPVETPFDRIEVRAGGIASALTSLDIFRIQRIADINIVAPVPVDGIVEVCQGGDVALEADDCGTTYEWFENMTGGTAIAEGLVFTVPTDWAPGLRTLYVQPKRFGCDYGARIPIVINVLESPTADDITVEADEDIYCVEDEVVLTATAVATIADPQFSWYFDANKSEPIVDGAEVNGATYAIVNGEMTISGLSAGNYTYYVSVRSGADGCENAAGDLASITITVDEESAPALTHLEQVFCEIDMPTVADLNTDGATGTVVWYSAATGGTALAADAALTAGTYYAAQVGDNCESASRTEVTVMITETPAPVLTSLEQTFCEIDMPTVADLNTDGATGTVVWYSAATGGTALAADAALTAGTYYAAQVGDNCESASRTEVTVMITETPAPVLTSLEQTFCEIDMPTVADLNTDGATGTVVWYSAATGGTALAADAALTAGMYYAAQVGDNCESVDRTEVTVVITETPAPALTSLEQTFCEIDMPTVADLNTGGATGSVVWYSAATGGTALAATDALATGTYYAAQVGDNCESIDRTEVTVTIMETPAPVLTQLEQTFCEIDMPTVADLNTDGATGTVVWYTVATGGTALAATDALATGTYYAAQVGDNCESIDRTEVEVTITETPAPALTSLEQTFCEIDMPTVADLNTDGATGTVIWYMAATGGTALAADAALTAGTYYAAQVGDNCESIDRTEVEVTITETPAPALTSLEQTFCEIDMPTVADLNTDGATGTVIWYTAATGGTALAADAALTAGTYYAAQVGDNCESASRTEVTVVITETPAPALTSLEQTFCEIDMPTVADLNTDGATGTVVWYSAATGGTALAADATLTAGMYYAAQVGDNCESVDRTEVTVVITETPAPTIDNITPEFCATDNRTLADLQVVGTDIKWYASATSTDVLPATTILEDGVTYYATQMGDNCESAERLAVTPVVSDCTALLSITKTADQDRVTAGESTSFTLTITNEGPGAILSGDVIKLGERPSEGVTITDYEVTSGNGTIDGSGNSATVTANVLIPVGGIITVKVTATVDADAPATITNGIDVWGPDKDPETDPKDDEDDTPPIPVDRESALSITKVADEARVKAGESTSFTLTITNNGPSVIEVGKEINLTERPGEGVTITGYEVTAGAATVAGNGNAAVLTTTGKIAVGGTLTVKVTADVAANAGETITNGITVWGPDKDPETDPEDDEDDTPPIPVDHEAVLSITKVADQNRVTAGEPTSFTLTITNEGPAVVASGKVISLTERPGEGVIITGYEVTSGNGTAAGTGNSATVTTSETIAVGGTIIVKVTATIDADAPATITNGIDVWGPDKNPETDPKDDEDDTPPIPVDRESVLGITKVADEARVKAGESTSFTLTITNNGPSFIEVGKEIDLTERPGEGVTITGYEVTAGTATVAGNGNTAVLTTTGKIAVGGTITVKVTADVAANAGETITNGITVWGPDKDPETDPEDDEDDTPPIPVDHDAVLSITKVADQARVKAGESTSFTLTITNEGPAIIASGEVISLTERPGQGVTITGYEVTSDNGTASGTANSATVTTSKAIAVGGTITVKVTADVAANAGETITNGISVWGPDKDPGTDDPDDEDDTPPIPVDHESVLSITKTANDQTVVSGGTTSFAVTVTNNGPAVIAVGETIAVEERPSAGLAITGYEVTSSNATIGGSGNNRQLTTTAAIAVGGTITFTVTADVTALGGSNVSNGIAVWGPDKDPGTDDPDDEDETPDIPVERPYTLSIEKVADQSLVTAGQSTTFTVTVTNNGPMAIEAGKEIALQERPGAGVTITGYQLVSGAASVIGTGNQATITTSDAIDVGATIVIKITADVAATATGTITNGITVWAPDRDPDTDDPDDEDDTDPIPVDATLVIPNLFTPNGDGLNDLFVIKNLLQYQGRELTVINRWGNQVYKSNNYNNDWDGGSLAEGTYYYILRVRNGNNGEWRTYKGAVAIIRVTGR